MLPKEVNLHLLLSSTFHLTAWTRFLAGGTPTKGMGTPGKTDTPHSRGKKENIARLHLMGELVGATGFGGKYVTIQQPVSHNWGLNLFVGCKHTNDFVFVFGAVHFDFLDRFQRSLQ